MEQTTINQRLIFLLDKLKISARTFSELIGESPTNTQNYVGTRAAEPRAGYIENVLRHFKTINPLWLVTGEGEPFLPGTIPSTTIQQTPKKVKGAVVGTIHGSVTYTFEECKKERDIYKAECDSLQKQLELLRDQLTMKDQLLAAKDEMLSLLRSGFNRPN